MQRKSPNDAGVFEDGLGPDFETSHFSTCIMCPSGKIQFGYYILLVWLNFRQICMYHTYFLLVHTYRSLVYHSLSSLDEKTARWSRWRQETELWNPYHDITTPSFTPWKDDTAWVGSREVAQIFPLAVRHHTDKRLVHFPRVDLYIIYLYIYKNECMHVCMYACDVCMHVMYVWDVWYVWYVWHAWYAWCAWYVWYVWMYWYVLVCIYVCM